MRQINDSPNSQEEKYTMKGTQKVLWYESRRKENIIKSNVYLGVYFSLIFQK